MRLCVVIPFYNHPRAIEATLASLKPLGLHCFIVDDGSDAQSRALLHTLAEREHAWLTVLRHARNQGKGAAMQTGCEAAAAAGFTHALQLDADGQHDTRDVPRFAALARQHPNALITGTAIYDASVPASRRYGRYVTHVWVWINTLSFSIKDSMCGFRIYPLEPALAAWRKYRIGQRMDFDTDIIVHMYWDGVPVVNVPTHVTYPRDGVSHFDVWADNVRISKMHARLFARLLVRFPQLLVRRARWPRRAQA